MISETMAIIQKPLMWTLATTSPAYGIERGRSRKAIITRSPSTERKDFPEKGVSGRLEWAWLQQRGSFCHEFMETELMFERKKREFGEMERELRGFCFFWEFHRLKTKTTMGRQVLYSKRFVNTPFFKAEFVIFLPQIYIYMCVCVRKCMYIVYMCICMYICV